MQYIKKRDGRIVEFNKNKITNAILKAFEQVDGEISSYALDKANNISVLESFNELLSDKKILISFEDILRKKLLLK